MRAWAIELRKEKRTGIMPIMLAIGVLGAAYELANFAVRGDALMALPLAPMDVLLTQLYGVVMVINMFGITVAACVMYAMEFSGSAIKKMYMLPMSAAGMYACKFMILALMFTAALVMQYLMLGHIGLTYLPEGAFDARALVAFAAYSLATSLPVLSLMLLISSRFESMWIPLGVGVAGFLSGMALANVDAYGVMLHPFVTMLHPAVVMSAQPDGIVIAIALAETAVLFMAGLWLARRGLKE